ncbi:MAG: sodium-dependent transporter [Deltaproteobacteria bacterium]|nr:sodium-dependent transporter [Deltaproteobacteria bacterium]
MSIDFLEKRGRWKSQTGFIMAAVGSAVGLGNIWRFSYMAHENGGGAFLIPYVIALLTVGIPLLVLEFGIGHERIGSAPLAFAKISEKWEWLGWWAVTFVMFGIALYYCVIIAWCINFVVFSFNLSWGGDPDLFFFKSFLGTTAGPESVGHVRTPILFSLMLVWFVNWFVVYQGVEKGIEQANKLFIPLLFVLMLVLIVWGLTLEGAKTGIMAYLTPDFHKLMTPKVWINAYSQIFFSLSLGFGIMIAYASYLPEKSDITKDALATALADCGFSIMAGFGVFAILGYMAQASQQPIENVVTESIGLAFVVYPKAISLLPGGSVFGILFFLSLTFAGLSSSISILEAFSSALMDKFHFNRKPTVSILCVLGFLGGVIFVTGGGLFWLDIVDHFISHYGLVLVGILECILVGWFFHIAKIRNHINKVSSLRLGSWWEGLIKYFVPLVLTIILLSDLIKEGSHPYGNYSWTAIILIGRDWLLFTLIIAFILSRRPWRTEAHRTKGRSDAP